MKISIFWVTTFLSALALPVHESSATAIGEILPLGDSITDGTGGGYRERLYLVLSNAGDLFRFVGSATTNATATLTANGQDHHEGHSGYRIDQIDGNLTGLVSSSPAPDTNNGGHWLDGGNGTGRAAIFPDLILLHIGTNDASQGRTAAAMQALLEHLLTEIANERPNAQVIVASLILRTDYPTLEAIQMAYNNGIPGIVAGKGANFHFLDMHAVLNAGDLVDGVHPSQSGYDKMADAWATAIHSVATLEPFSVAAAGSRRSHGAAGTFDIDLPLAGEPGVECRSGGGNHTLVFTFTSNVSSGNASVTEGSGRVAGSPTFTNNVMSVNLTEVMDVQQITVTLSGVTDAYSRVLPSTPAHMNVLVGDTTGNKQVTSSDVAHADSQFGAVVTGANFPADVTANGEINGADISLIKSRSGYGIP